MNEEKTRVDPCLTMIFIEGWTPFVVSTLDSKMNVALRLLIFLMNVDNLGTYFSPSNKQEY